LSESIMNGEEEEKDGKQKTYDGTTFFVSTCREE
jgi:hypothetical protein